MKFIEKIRGREWVNVVQILAGLFFCKVAYNSFLIPNNIAAGGFTGIGQLLNYAVGLPVGAVSMMLNIPLFLFSMKQMGWQFGVRSFIAMILFSAFIDIRPFPAATDDMILSTLFGGILSGVGFGLILRGNATTGGTEMLASLIHRFFPVISVGRGTFIFDAMVIIASAFAFDAEAAMYAVICIFLCTFMVDMVLEGPDSSHAYFIISDKSEEIAQQVLTQMGRGVTGLNGVGMYTMKEKRVLFCVVSRMETMRLRRIVFSTDSAAFMVVCKSHETLGEGFKQQ